MGVMGRMLDLFEADFGDDDDDGLETICELMRDNINILGSECEAIAPRLLPPLLKILQKRPQEKPDKGELDADSDDSDADDGFMIKSAISEDICTALRCMTSLIGILN